MECATVRRMCFAEEHNTMIKPELEIELLNREIKELTILPVSHNCT